MQIFRSHASFADGCRSGGALTASGFLMLPAIAILVAGVVARDFEQTSIVIVVSMMIGIGAAILAVRRTAAFLLCSVEVVVVGFAPLWRTQLLTEEISAVGLIKIDAFAEYGGWGIKGSARAERGRLYSAGGRHAVQLRTVDGRTFVVAFSDPREAERARNTVAESLERA